jgi:hypothetical protein
MRTRGLVLAVLMACIDREASRTAALTSTAVVGVGTAFAYDRAQPVPAAPALVGEPLP